jgi:TolB-like protein/Flp pilus assembly protein TadD
VTEGGGEEQVPGARSGTPDVFISYASPDSAVADAACESLERAGVTCWIAPRDVTPGAFYADEIVHAIDAAKAIVLILSQHAAESPHVLREIERATSKRHPVVSLRIDHAPLPAGLEYFLNTSHWLDASGGDPARAMPKLVSATQVALGVPAVTPVAPSGSRAPALSASQRSPNRATIVVASLVGLAIAGFAFDRIWVSGRKSAATALVPAATTALPVPAAAAPAIPEKSVAVLPFLDMSEKKDQEYFSDGLSEELIDRLTKIPELRVPARTSSFYFKGKQATIADIAKALAVAHVLEGSVRKSGNTLRITAQLVRVDNGYHVWSETYDRKLDDIFKVQDEIAGAVVGHLKLALLNGLTAPGSTTNIEAYNLFLQARYFTGRGNRDDLDKAVVLYDRAIAIDTNFALAYAALADCYARRVAEGVDTNGIGYAKSRAAAERAIALDPNLAEGYRALAYARLQYELDWAATRDLLQKAQALDPNNSLLLLLTGHLTQATGTLADAEGYFRRAIDNDPLNVRLRRYLARALFYQNKLSDAEQTLRQMIELDPRFPGAHYQLGIVLLARGDPKAALAAMEVEPSSWKPLGLPLAYWALRRTTDARAALAAVVADSAGSEFQVAEIYGYIGEPDEALRWLEAARVRHDPGLFWVRRDPLLQSVVADLRYKAFLRKINLTE